LREVLRGVGVGLDRVGLIALVLIALVRRRSMTDVVVSPNLGMLR